MTVKASRYLFKKIGGMIVPMRKGLELATKSQSFLGDMILSKKASTIGAGVDFIAYKNADDVIKVPKMWGGKITRGTSNKWFKRNWPETGDKLAVSKALADNLPNFGIPTTETSIIRLSRKKRGLLQPYISSPDFRKLDDAAMERVRSGNKYLQWEGDNLLRNHGLDIDTHHGNIRNGQLIDSGGNLLKSQVKKVRHSDTAKEILGIQTYYGTQIRDHYNKAEILTETAALQGQSPGLLRKLKALRKKGFRLVPKANSEDTLRLINPIPTKNQKISRDTVRFIRRRGKIIPIRTKK